MYGLPFWLAQEKIDETGNREAVLLEFSKPPSYTFADKDSWTLATLNVSDICYRKYWHHLVFARGRKWAGLDKDRRNGASQQLV